MPVQLPTIAFGSRAGLALPLSDGDHLVLRRCRAGTSRLGKYAKARSATRTSLSASEGDMASLMRPGGKRFPVSGAEHL